MENVGFNDLILGEIRNTEEFTFLMNGRLSPIDNLYYTERPPLPPTPLKDKAGIIIWAKHREYKPFVQVQILGDDGK